VAPAAAVQVAPAVEAVPARVTLVVLALHHPLDLAELLPTQIVVGSIHVLLPLMQEVMLFILLVLLEHLLLLQVELVPLTI
jgi:hypothetical protein